MPTSTSSLTDDEIRSIFKTYRRIAVIGLSPEPDRASYGVSRYMKNNGYEISGVRPGGPEQILDRPVFESLAKVPGPLEIIDVFRKSEAIPGIVEEVLQEVQRRPEHERPKVLWLQEGVTHPEAEARARAAGLQVISDHCILKEHRRLMR
ncbi:MAG: CoA-binding protein [Bdellovibrionaceae bacterium]|nr:CoA-binding protein [Pseudobdellovibrionaceae bacterium]